MASLVWTVKRRRRWQRLMLHLSLWHQRGWSLVCAHYCLAMVAVVKTPKTTTPAMLHGQFQNVQLGLETVMLWWPKVERHVPVGSMLPLHLE